MTETQTITTFPWEPESTITGNLTIFNLRENLLARLKTERGVHIETLLVVTGAIGGFAAQQAIWAEIKERGTPATYEDFTVLTTKAGETYYYGDKLNAYLLPQSKHSTPLPIWSVVAGAAVQAGMPENELPDINEMFSHVTKTVGFETYGMPRVPERNKPHLSLRQSLTIGWPFLCTIMKMPLGTDAAKYDLPLHVKNWPIIVSLVARHYIIQAKDILDPKIALTLVMETAIAGSKMDPKALFVQKT